MLDFGRTNPIAHPKPAENRDTNSESWFRNERWFLNLRERARGAKPGGLRASVCPGDILTPALHAITWRMNNVLHTSMAVTGLEI